MHPADQEFARTLPLLQELDPARVDRLLAGASIERHTKGTILFSEGDFPNHLDILLSGSVQAYTNDGGRDYTILIFTASDIFMPAAALVDERYLLSARVLKPAKVMRLQVDAVRAEMVACPLLACRLLKLLAGQMRITLRHIKDIKVRSGAQRLAAYLLHLVDHNGHVDAAQLPFPKGTLASRLGMTRESFSRAIQTLSDHGIIVRGHRVFLRDRTAAEHFCDPDPLIDGGEHGLDVQAW